MDGVINFVWLLHERLESDTGINDVRVRLASATAGCMWEEGVGADMCRVVGRMVVLPSSWVRSMTSCVRSMASCVRSMTS